ncbi:hypothetical protein [Ktedonobacter robiniae]|uniref:Zinc ribbon domain-containing protein n=1 Tax=Ktedonobacter robiniae TaxID=2778365 RepID=A0ABQ3UKH7_9CHLR|nr:hypothetical protein [Ktedonobacter robiniae]GHO52900.1 hypothetical protein KSB_13750 [Ktedonobacter robiniae]
MRRKQQRTLALQTVCELLRIMDIAPETVHADQAFTALDELYYTQPQSVAYRWWESATEREIDCFIDEWEEWREQELAKCPFCQYQVENRDFVFCQACSALLEGVNG